MNADDSHPGRARIDSVDEATAFLEGLINYERRPGFRYERLGLAAIEALLARVGDPHRALSVLHVAGSKGKGSTCLFAESVLRALGKRVGVFTSPHLLRWTERFRIDGREVDGRALARAVDSLRPHVEQLRVEDPGRAPTFFDATTAAALLLFVESKVDHVVLEVGLGGRLDSTNVVTPVATCITSIELEHTDKLGDTLAKIAAEKAGILKPGVPCVVGALPQEAMAVVEARAAEVGAPLSRLGQEIEVEVLASAGTTIGTALRLRDRGGDSGSFELEAHLGTLGRHQIENAALAVALVRRMGAHSQSASASDSTSDWELAVAARQGLRTAILPGRIEVMGQRPWIVVDSAHTGASARALADALALLPGERRRLVVSVSAEKDLDAILEPLMGGTSAVTATCSDPIRSLDAQQLAARIAKLAPDVAVEIEPDPRRAMREALRATGRADLLCSTGSVYMAGIARDVIEQEERMGGRSGDTAIARVDTSSPEATGRGG